MTSTAASISVSSLPEDRVKIVSRINVGGSAGLRIMIALPLAAPPTSSMPRLVVSVNSSLLARVPGPADFDAMEATISASCTVATDETAADRKSDEQGKSVVFGEDLGCRP